MPLPQATQQNREQQRQPVPPSLKESGLNASDVAHSALGWPEPIFLIGKLYVGQVKEGKNGKRFRSVRVAFTDNKRNQCYAELMLWENKLGTEEERLYLSYHERESLFVLEMSDTEPHVYNGGKRPTITYRVEKLLPCSFQFAQMFPAPQQQHANSSTTPRVQAPAPQTPVVVAAQASNLEQDLEEMLQTERDLHWEAILRVIPGPFEQQAFFDHFKIIADASLWEEEELEAIDQALAAWPAKRKQVWLEQSLLPEQQALIQEIRARFPSTQLGNKFLIQVRDTLADGQYQGVKIDQLSAEAADLLIQALREGVEQALQKANSLQKLP